jgi:aminopeptidase N
VAGSVHGWSALGLSWAGGRMSFAEPGVPRHYAPSRAVRITHIDLTLRLWPEARRFEGEATISLEPLATYAGRFALDLDEVDVVAVEDADGLALDWSHDDGALTIRGSAPTAVRVRWTGNRPRRGLYFTGPTSWAPGRQHMAWTQCQDEDGHFLLPCHDHPGVRHGWRIRLEGPAGYTLLSNGAQIDSGEADGRAYAVFEQAQPMPVYLLTAVCAQLSAVEDRWRDRPVRYLVPVGEEAHARTSMGATPAMMEFLSERTGVDYPWPRYDQVVVHDFVFGGMENTACTTMTDVLLVPPNARLEWDPESLVVHELAHQWFGDLVTCQDWSQGWLNESWATLCEALWWEHTRSAADAMWYRFETMQQYFHEHDGRYRRPIVSYTFREPIDVFDRHLYQKGSCVLWTLRAELGEGPFWAGVTAYLTARAHQVVHTRDFQRALEETTGRNLDGFFHQWLHQAGHPALTVVLGEEDGLLTVRVRQTQSGDDVPDAFHFTLPIEITLADGGTRSLRLPVRERERGWAVPVDGEIAAVRVDPDLSVLARITLEGPTRWIAPLLEDASPALALRAARALLATGSVKGTAAVVAALLNDGHFGARSQMASLLGKHGGALAKEALLAVATDADADARVRRSAVQALGTFRDEQVADAMFGLLAADLPTIQLRGAALTTLGATHDPRALPVLQRHLEVPSWADHVRQRALAALAQSRDDGALPILVAMSAADQPPRARGAAAAALGVLGDALPDCKRPARERLVQMLSEPGFRAQLGALSGLTTLRDPAALGALEQVRTTAPDGRTRRLAYEAQVRTREGGSSEAGMARLREQLEGLAEENRKLRSRIEKLEVSPRTD